MNKSSSKSSVHSLGTSDSENYEISFVSQLQNDVEELAFNLCGKVPAHKLLAAVVFIIEKLTLISISLDSSYSWEERVKGGLSSFSWIRGANQNGWSYYPTFCIMFAIAVILSILPIICEIVAVSRAFNKNRIFGILNFLLVLVYRILYYFIITILIIPLKCNFKTGNLVDFESQQCLQTPNVILFGITFVPIIIMIGMKTTVVLFMLEIYNQIKSPFSTTNGRFLFASHIVETLLLITTDVLHEYRVVVPIIALVVISILLIFQLRYMYYYNFWTNLANGSALAISCGGFIASLVTEFTKGNPYSIFVLFSAIPFVIVFICLACIRNWLFRSYLLAQMDKANGSLKDAFTWFSPLDFDVAAQSFSDKEMQHRIYMLGYEKHKTSLKMKVYYAIFLLETQEKRHTLRVLLQHHPIESIWDQDIRFSYLYCKVKKRELEMTQNQGDKKIIKELGRAKKCFDKIKVLLKQIWEIFLEEKADFSKLPGIITTIEKLENKFEKIIQDLLKIDPNHVGTLRAYAVFEAEIRRNLHRAEILFSEADIAEDKRVMKAKNNAKKFVHYMKQAVSFLTRKSSSTSKINPSYVIDKNELTPQSTAIDLEDIDSASDKDMKLNVHKDADTQSTASYESHVLTFLKHSTGKKYEDIVQTEKLRSSIDKSPNLSIIVLRCALILSVLLGICLLVIAFVKANNMLQRFGVAGDTINMAVDARDAVVKVLNSLRAMQVTMSPLANLTQASANNFTHYRDFAQFQCSSLRNICNTLYERAQTGEESEAWRDSTRVPIQFYFPDGSSITKNSSLFDACLTFTRLCHKVVSYPVSIYSSGEILNDVDYKFLILNGIGSLTPGLQEIVNVLFESERVYTERFIVFAVIIPLCSIISLIIVLPINIWIWWDQRKSFKMIQLVEKSVIASILKEFEKKKQTDDEEVHVHVNVSTLIRFSINFIGISLFLGVLIGVVSLLGVITSSQFEDQIHEIDAACLVQQHVNRISYFSIELVFATYSYYDNSTIAQFLKEDTIKLKMFDEGLRTGDASLSLRAADVLKEFREFYYTRPCEDVTKFECLTLHQLITVFIEETDRLLNNYTLDSVHFANIKYLVNNILSDKLATQIEMFKRKSDTTITPVQIVMSIWISIALLLYIVIFTARFWRVGGLLGKEIMRAKKLLLFVPPSVVTKNIAIMNFLTNKRAHITHALQTSRNSREGMYSRILQTTSDAVIEFTSKRKINFVNPAAESMFECTSKQLIGELFETLFTQESIDDLLHWISMDCNKKQAFQCEMNAVSKASTDEPSTFPVRVVIAYSESTKLLKDSYYVAFIRNIMAERKQQELLMEERKKSHELICNILPKPIASQKMSSEETDKIIVSSHAEVTMLFADIVGFTALSAKTSPEQLISILNELFSAFDELTLQYKLEKIKTIGDCYFVASGVPDYRIGHAEDMLEYAIDMLEIVEIYNKKTQRNIQIRIGINSGPVVAGVIGKQKFCYDLWGDSVNVASRMESTGFPGKIQVSRETYKYLYSKYHFKERELQNVKGKGQMLAYIYEGRKVPRKHQIVNIAKLLNYYESSDEKNTLTPPVPLTHFRSEPVINLEPIEKRILMKQRSDPQVETIKDINQRGNTSV